MQYPCNPDGSEPSLIGATNKCYTPSIKFYFDDVFSAKEFWKEIYNFLEQHILPRFLWSNLCLSFKKVKLIMD